MPFMILRKAKFGSDEVEFDSEVFAKESEAKRTARESSKKNPGYHYVVMDLDKVPHTKVDMSIEEARAGGFEPGKAVGIRKN